MWGGGGAGLVEAVISKINQISIARIVPFKNKISKLMELVTKLIKHQIFNPKTTEINKVEAVTIIKNSQIPIA